MNALSVSLKTMDVLMVADHPANPEIDLRIEDDAWLKHGDETALAELARRAISAAAHSSRTGLVDLLLTNDEEMQNLNRDWRRKDKPTDVLSFPADELAFRSGFLGDIALGYGVFTADVAKLNRSFEAHFSHLLIHGYLHLLGYDHIEDTEASEMETLEADILAELGYADPYSASEEK